MTFPTTGISALKKIPLIRKLANSRTGRYAVESARWLAREFDAHRHFTGTRTEIAWLTTEQLSVLARHFRKHGWIKLDRSSLGLAADFNIDFAEVVQEDVVSRMIGQGFNEEIVVRGRA